MRGEYIPKSRLNVSGKMSKKDAGTVGNKLANAALIIAVAVLLWVIRWW